MTVSFPEQKRFGKFVADRYGKKWVYAHRASDRIKTRYPGAAIITPKQQRQLRADYKREWGEEYSPAAWHALVALRAVEATLVRCSEKLAVQADVVSMVHEAIRGLTT